MARDLAIDLGTASTLVYAKGRGIVLDEPSVIALHDRTGEVLAMGHEAERMLGRTPGDISAVRPLRHGAITDGDVATRLLRLLLARAGATRLARPRVVLCVPTALTDVERRAVADAARRAGAAEAHLIEQPVAAAIGAGLPIHEPLATMVVDIGGGTTQAAVLSLGGVVACEAARVGSFDLDTAIQDWVKGRYGVVIGERTAEEVKVSVGSPGAPSGGEVTVRGRDLVSGLPKVVVLSPKEVWAAIDEQVVAICDTVAACVGQAPPDLARDLLSEGIHLVGGGSLLRGLDRRLAEETGVPVRLVAAPLDAVVLGAGRCVESWDALKVLFLGARG